MSLKKRLPVFYHCTGLLLCLIVLSCDAADSSLAGSDSTVSSSAPSTIPLDTAALETEPDAVVSDPMTLTEMGYFRPLVEECCTQPGAASECWRDDAEQDGVLCDDNLDCDSGSCDVAKGRCRCDLDSQCSDGICVNHVCGPSWCNGYLVCSCWGGCEWWSPTPGETPADVAASQGKYCCEGVYAEDPVDVDPALGGFFSLTPCSGCVVNEDCADNNPCTTDLCVDDICQHTKLTGDQDAIPDAANCPFNDTLFASDCARAKCEDGVCTVEMDWKTGNVCSDSPGTVPMGAHEDCYTRACAADGTCSVIIGQGNACRVGENDCSNATCNLVGACVDAPLNAAGLAAHPECCNPAIPASFDDAHPCTDDYCCYSGAVAATCAAVPAYTQRNVPNFDAAAPGDCCTESANCNDANGCTEDICCNSVNAGLAICGGNGSDPSFECASAVRDVPGCCDAAPASLADNCVDIFSCTRDVCCTAAAIATAASGDPCYGADEFNCAAPSDFTPLAAGCCIPGGDAETQCADGNLCTAKTCDPLSHQCETEPKPLIAGCCGPTAADACADVDGNVCTAEICCDPVTIADAVAGHPCFGKNEWNCEIEVASLPGCCTTAADCNDGNPCTKDSCVANTCVFGPLDDLTAVAGVCCTTGGANDSQCTDGNDPGDCTQNMCCSPAMVATAVAGDPCFAASDWNCAHPAENPLPEGCCTPTTFGADCNPSNNLCVEADCVNNNCSWQANDAFELCCSADSDCPVNDVNHPCLSTSSCDNAGTPVTNATWGQCDVTFAAAGTSCGTGGDCFDAVCPDPANRDWSCSAVSLVPAGTRTCSPPNAPPCGEYWCDGNGGCTALTVTTTPYSNETCAGAGLGGNAAIVENGTNVCATDAFEPDSTGLFAECGGETYSDVVYSYDDTVADNYDLVHRVITVTDADGTFDPLVHTRTECGDSSTQTRCNNDCTFAGSNYNAVDYGGFIAGACQNNESTVVTGPLAVEDVPSHNATAPVAVGSQDFDQNGVRDGYDVVRTHTTSVIVDSRYSLPSFGGNFELTIDAESHNNNDCREIASYSPAPVIDGNFGWKQRWRGTTAVGDYVNYFGAMGPAMGMVDPVSATDPHQAFFKVDMPANSGWYWAYVDSKALAQRGQAGHQIDMDAATLSGNFFDATLSLLQADATNANECSSIGVTSSSYGNFGPARMLLNTETPGWGPAWLAVGNRYAGDYGDYELTIVKQQPDFFGLFSTYSAYGATKGCGSLNYFDGEGVRLDFVPSGGTQNGYLMTIATIGDGPDSCPGKNGSNNSGWDWGWLVHPRCYGSAGDGSAITHNEWRNQGAHGEIQELPFWFPMGGKAYNHLYFDTAGRVMPLERINDSSNPCGTDADCNTDYAICASAPRGCVCRTVGVEDKCFINPGAVDVDPDVEKFFAPQEAEGYGPMIASAWGAFTPRWLNGTYGYMTAQSVIFEGTTAYVISWIAMEIDTSNPKHSAFDNTNTWNRYYARPSHQVVLRDDGRMAFYYRPDNPTAAWDEAVSRGSFVVGVSGGISNITCTSDAECQSAYGSDAVCDNIGPADYTPSNTCYRRIQPLMTGNGLGNE